MVPCHGTVSGMLFTRARARARAHVRARVRARARARARSRVLGTQCKVHWTLSRWGAYAPGVAAPVGRRYFGDH